jgi:hypothetical protein
MNTVTTFITEDLVTLENQHTRNVNDFSVAFAALSTHICKSKQSQIQSSEKSSMALQLSDSEKHGTTNLRANHILCET